jgi:hypothetical protein
VKQHLQVSVAGRLIKSAHEAARRLGDALAKPFTRFPQGDAMSIEIIRRHLPDMIKFEDRSLLVQLKAARENR